MPLELNGRQFLTNLDGRVELELVNHNGGPNAFSCLPLGQSSSRIAANRPSATKP